MIRTVENMFASYKQPPISWETFFEATELIKWHKGNLSLCDIVVEYDTHSKDCTKYIIVG